MSHRITFLYVAVVLLALGGALAVSLRSPPTTQASGADGDLPAALRAHIPAGAISCGAVALGSDATAAWNCANTSAAKRVAFWVAAEAPMDDAKVWVAVFGAKGGALTRVDYDSSDTGGARLPTQCARLVRGEALAIDCS